MTWSIGSILVLTFAFSAILVGVVRRHALRNNIVDLPNMRSSHTVPTPRAGGIAVVVSFVAALCALCLCRVVDARTAGILIISGCAIAAVGYLDDRRQLTAKARFAVHLAAAVFAIALLGGIPEPELARWGLGGFWIGFAFAVLVLAWGTNLFNFMDGIDGIAASEAIFMSMAGAYLNWLDGGDSGVTAAMLCLSAATAGCLVWNWPPARIFMGDVGSGFLGFMVTLLVILTCNRGSAPIEVLPILGGVFLVDATVTLIRRFVRGDRWMEAHRMHAYQRLSRKWQSHKLVTVLVIAVNFGWLLPWAYMANHSPTNARIYFGIAMLPLIAAALLAGAGKRD
ncbi:MAG TPA: glycosyltransferase family 4 protein [Steroidobacteraceae bacterium]|nr:glycosyltransferase family 4 protein [Steroidobacteraceae bacterium]